MEIESSEQDYQRATSTKRFKAPDGYGTLKNGILKKSSSISDIAGLSLNNDVNNNQQVSPKSSSKSNGNYNNLSSGTQSPSGIRSLTESPKVQFNEAQLNAIAKSLEKDKKKKKKPFRKSLKRSAQSCPDLVALAEEKGNNDSKLGGSGMMMMMTDEDDYIMGNTASEMNKQKKKAIGKSLKPRRNLTVPRMENDQNGKIPAFDPKKLNKIVSCPDFLNVYEGFYTEDERKNRRLARNRASARLRRQRKRLMIDILEAKVRKLETRLDKIKNLKWSGNNNNVDKNNVDNKKMTTKKNNKNNNDDGNANMNTISDKMTNPIPVRDLGVDLNHPDLLDTNTRNGKVNLLLQGIRGNIDIICADALRSSVLGWVGTDGETTEATLKKIGSEDNIAGIQKLRQELIKILDLTPDQLQKLGEIEKQNAAAHEFSFSVFLKQCVLLFTQQRLHNNPILDDVIAQFGQVCQERQQKKFLTWSGQNVVAISGLDFCGPKIKDIDKTTVLKKLNLQTNCSRVDGDQFENLPSGQYFPRADDTSNLPVFFFGGRDSVY